MKWEPPALMLLVMALGVWLVIGTGQRLTGYPELRDGATTAELRISSMRGLIETVRADQPADTTFRILRRDGSASPVLTAADLEQLVGQGGLTDLTASEPPFLFRLFNITRWTSFIWVALGLAGQIAFFGRMAIQWIISEKQRTSVVPPAFWYLSFVGGVLLFTYFVWRQDIIGVLGQTTGVVIYGRNIRLIHKQRRREERANARAEQNAAGNGESAIGNGGGSEPRA